MILVYVIFNIFKYNLLTIYSNPLFQNIGVYIFYAFLSSRHRRKDNTAIIAPAHPVVEAFLVLEEQLIAK